MKDSPAHLYRRFRYHVGPTPDPWSSDRWAAQRLEGDELALAVGHLDADPGAPRDAMDASA